MNIVIFLLIGIVSGWIAGLIMKGSGFGLVGNMVVGILGALAGGLIFGALNIEAAGLGGEIIVSVVGALVLLFLISLIKTKKS